MPLYSYTATTSTGEQTTGTQEAGNELTLARMLREQGYVLISAEEQQEKAPRFRLKNISIPFLSRVSLTDKLFFTRNLKVLIAAGVSMQEALETLSTQSKNKTFQHAILDVKEQVVRGEALSSAIAKHPNVFSELYVNMVKVGEESGTIEEVLDNVTTQMEREHEFKSKIKGALTYPAVVVTAMIGIGIIMLAFVVPRLASTFEELGVELPLMTRLVIATGNFFANQWYIALPLFIGIIVAMYQIARTKPGKRALDNAALHAPVISEIVHKANNAFMARTLSSLVGSGVALVRSLEITAGVLGNVYFRESLLDASKRVQKGSLLSEILKQYPGIYTTMTIQMLEVGERTGQTVEILQKLAEFYEEEVTAFTENLASVIEPILMLVVGAAVGFFAVAMLQPMYSMLSAF